MDETTRPHRKPLPVIHVNGFPGTGKLTIAGHLIELFSEQQVSAKLVHNHLLIDPADAVLHRTQPGYQRLRHAIRASIFDTLATESATFETVYIFTDFQSSDPIGSAVCAEYSMVAKRRGSELISIVLNCEEEENLRRVTASDRKRTKKITDGELVRRFRSDGAPVHRYKDETVSLELDVTNHTARGLAGMIMVHCRQQCLELQATVKV